MGEENNNNNAWGDDDEDDFFRQITEIQSNFERGRPRTRDEIDPEKRSRKNRWNQDRNNIVSLPGVPKTIPPGLTDDQLSSLLIRVRIDEITKKLTVGPIEFDTKEDRSRSPTPVYDNTGKRTNTREQRTRDKLAKERHGLISSAQQVHPNFKPPLDYQPPHEKKTMKIYIPVKDHPEYNFIGLIIGPRGNTQKKMEKESGAKIAIRGKGSMKDGKATKQQFAETDELHVLLTGDTQEQLEKAAVLVRQYLVPVEEGKNEHKRQQLRELAEMNGTLRERPAFMGNRSWTPVDIKCVHCGEISHPSSDCPLKGRDSGNLQQIEQEYYKFIAEIKDYLGFDNDNNNNNYNNNNSQFDQPYLPPPPPPSSSSSSNQSSYHHQNGNSHNNNMYQSQPNSNNFGGDHQQWNNNNINNSYNTQSPPHHHQSSSSSHHHQSSSSSWNNNASKQHHSSSSSSSPYGPPGGGINSNHHHQQQHNNHHINNSGSSTTNTSSPYGPQGGNYY